MSEADRRFHRLGVALEMQVQGTDPQGATFIEATSSDDMSRGGCSFQLSHEVKLGTELELEILRPPIGRRPATPFLTRGAVVRCSKEDEQRYLVAVEFTGPHFPTFASETTTGT